MISPGSVFFSSLTPPPPAPGTLLGANNGLSTDAATGTIAQLGQTIARAGNPAALLQNREIVLAAFVLSLRKILGRDTIDLTEGAIDISGDSSSGTGSGGALLNMQDSNSTAAWNVLVGAATVLMTWDNTLVWRHTFGNSFVEMLGGLMIQDGIGLRLRNTASLVESFADTDYAINMDTTGGNATVSLNPVTMRANRLGKIKKVSIDANTITLNATSGLIVDIPPGAASFVFAAPGTCIEFQSDGTNIYIQ